MSEKVECFLWPFILAGFSLLFLVVRKIGRSNFSAKPPPGPLSLPLLGNLLHLGRNPHRSLAQLAQKHGPVMALKLGNLYTIVISSPSSARQVLQTKDHILCSRQIPDVVKNQGHSEFSTVWMPTNSTWKYLRTLMKMHLFNPRALDASQSLRQRKIRELIAFIRGQAGQPVYIGRIALCTMLNLISNSFFSMDMVDINSDAPQGFKDLMNGIMEEAGAPNISDFFPPLALLDLQGRRRRFGLNYDKLSTVFERIMRSRLEGEDKVKNHDILNALLKHREEDDSKLSLPIIKCFLLDSFVAGSDTSSTAVEWAMAELLRKPELMERVRLEIESVVGSEREVDESDIPRLSFFNAVLKETLRLHPPVPLLLPHKAEENTEINGYIVPRGSQVLINAWAIGRDEQVWESPDCFMPERFMGVQSGQSEVNFNGHHFELIPFGSGRRMCPGLPLGTRMVQLMLASLIQSFKWKLPEGITPANLDLQEKFGISLVMASPLKASGLPFVLYILKETHACSSPFPATLK